MHPIRNGNINISEIVALTSRGKREMTAEELAARPKSGKGSKTTQIEFGLGEAALTFISECNMERRLGRALEDESGARPLTWGKLLEKRAFTILPLAYTFSSTETDVHQEIDYWVGSKDGSKDEKETVIDIKCPMTLKSFCNLVDPIYEGLEGIECMSEIRKRHKDGDKYYYQLVSNAIINGSKFAELIIYVPYLSELDEIRDMCNSVSDENSFKVFWINNAQDSELPHLIDGGYYKNINIVRFEVPQSDKYFLTECVIEAGKLLQKRV